MQQGPRVEEQAPSGGHPWHRVLWLTGVDYFSSLGYQPGIALLAVGALSPLATLVLVAVTLCFAMPMYRQVASRSFAGQGSVAMLENLLDGWWGKGVVLVLLGFACTAFVITMTLSSADAAVHLTENPLLAPWLRGHTTALTLLVLAVLAWIFLMGFKEALGVARLVALPYLALNLVVIGRCAWEAVRDPGLWSHWTGSLSSLGDPAGLLLVSALAFPQLALGLSGFETGVAVMPQVDGGPGDKGQPLPWGRVRATRRLLAAAALIMSFLLAASSLVTVLLVPPEAYRDGGPAAGRALAWLAHRYLGEGFGSLYDLSTILILGFAGASAMTGLLNLIPRYIPRFGMAPRWILHTRPLTLALFGVNVLVTLAFHADVERQAGAYATGVLSLMLSASVAVALAFARESRGEPGRRKWAGTAYFTLASAVFLYALVDNLLSRPDGLVIALLFVAAILVLSGLSRTVRSSELRVADIRLEDARSIRLFKAVRGRKVNLVPLRSGDAEARRSKERWIRRHHRVEGPLVFLIVRLMDNRSEFLASLRMRLRKEGPHYVMTVSGAVAVANTIAYVSELIDPKSLFLTLTRQDLMTQSFRYVLWGEGEVGLDVYSTLVKYWSWTPPGDVRPRLVLVSN